MDLLEKINLVPLHNALCLVSVALAIVCHSYWGRGVLGVEVSSLVRTLQRTSFIVYAMAQCAALAYSYQKDWQPWPPYVIAQFGPIMFMVAVVIAAYEKQRHADHSGKVSR